MSASANERGPQKLRFFDWLVNQIDSRAYEGLYWLDEKRTTFRIPWKHNSRKNLVADDYKIFQEWAAVGGKYEEGSSNPSKWKTNFRCALKSTNRFELLSSMQDPDPHHVYKIIPFNTVTEATPPVDTNNGSNPDDDPLRISPHSEGLPALSQPTPLIQQGIEVTFGTLSLGNLGPVQNGNVTANCCPYNGDTLRWIIQQANLKQSEVQLVSWSPAQVENTDNPFAACGQDYCQTTLHVDQNGCLPLGNGVLNSPVENSCYEPMSVPSVNSQTLATLPLQYIQQNTHRGPDQFNNVGETPHNNNCFIQSVFVNEEPRGDAMMMINAVGNDYQMPANQQATAEQNLLVPPAVLCPAEQTLLNSAPLLNNPGAITSHLDVSIYYRGRLLHETEMTANSCMFTYNKHHHCGPALGNPQIVQFPNPEELPDRKQVKHTLILLQNAGLVLYEKNHKICVKRLDKCKVYWAFSKQLDNIAQHSQFKCLLRETETEIFDYKQFFQELKDFHENRRSTSPDYTIYLCFGQCFSAARPKESKLILVKLVPKFCREWHEYVLREGSSSLSSDNMSLQISYSLMDMIEQYLMDN
ncbi:interferon regulatory factor 7 [Eublepharis macularius]|uniref:Interferon regulatory factor 7 n=1 Tax=Eublepharis macularius TaxID=481883 RepID=A0AA97KSP8_EUBMA|nr:interferon regulatory factor 7 [Eublepharis macularius]XP_054828168.1 interferon regulatory factor 7 [Eublepharis macularius]XP_054828169.1 interferon regulatory factor 7 [Eublepharis macularius]